MTIKWFIIHSTCGLHLLLINRHIIPITHIQVCTHVCVNHNYTCTLICIFNMTEFACFSPRCADQRLAPDAEPVAGGRHCTGIPRVCEERSTMDGEPPTCQPQYGAHSLQLWPCCVVCLHVLGGKSSVVLNYDCSKNSDKYPANKSSWSSVIRNKTQQTKYHWLL